MRSIVPACLLALLVLVSSSCHAQNLVSQVTVPPSDGVPLLYNGKVYFTTNDTMFCFGVPSGDLVWSQTVDSTSSFDINVAPIVVGSWLYAKSAQNSIIYVFDYLNRVPVVTYTVPESIANCQGPTSGFSFTHFVEDRTDATSQSVYWAGGSGNCVVQLKYTGGGSTGFTIGAAIANFTVSQPPIVGTEFVWYVDDHGFLYWQRKVNFTAGAGVFNSYRSQALIVGTNPSPLSENVEAQTLFFSCQGVLYSYGKITLIRQFLNNIYSVDDTIAPIQIDNKVFVSTTNGYFVSLEASTLSLHLPVRFNVSLPQSVPAARLGAPVISPTGVFVFANSNGIFAWDANGVLKFFIAQTQNGAPLTCEAPLAYRDDVVYVMCNGQLRLVDGLTGVILKTISGIVNASSRVVVDPIVGKVLVIANAKVTVLNATSVSASNTATRSWTSADVFGLVAGLVAGVIIVGGLAAKGIRSAKSRARYDEITASVSSEEA